MAVFAKGKGRKRTEWTAQLYGAVLRTHERLPSDCYLPGYRRFASAAQARAELQRLLAARLKQGFEPADDGARALQAELGLQAPGEAAPPTLPLRQDIHVYNEATGFCVAWAGLAGKGLDSDDPAWTKAVQAGRLLPMSLVQDDPFVLRVVAGEALSAAEAEEWVGRVEGRLELPDGRMLVCGGAEFLMSDFDGDDPHALQYVRPLALPAGAYRATLYSYLHGVNGQACLDHLAGGYDRMEPPGRWFRRSHPGEPFPAWLEYWCIASTDADPGHEAEWQGRSLPEDGPRHVDFLLHLEPESEPAPRTRARPALEDGWFAETSGARLPEQCPRGVLAGELTGDEDAVPEGGWIYLHDVGAATAGLQPEALDEPLSLPLEHFADAYMLAWFADPATRAELGVQLPAGSAPVELSELPEGMIAWPVDGGLHLGIDSDLYGPAILRALQALAPALAALPAGSLLELCCGAGESAAGRLRCRGPLQDGVWRIEALAPPQPAARCRAVLALARDCAGGKALPVRDAAEATEIVEALCERYDSSVLDDNRPAFADGALRLSQPSPGLLRLLGVAAWSLRYGRG